MTDLTIVIPSFNRAGILLKTIEQLLEQRVVAGELMVIDQTDYAEADTDLQALAQLHEQGKIRFVRRTTPSIPAAMNCGLLLARSDYVLFLDDDIQVTTEFIAAHCKELQSHACAAQVGQVLQPNQVPIPLHQKQPLSNGLRRDLDFPFNAQQAAEIHNCMAGNLCVHRQSAIDAGGFDENFIGVAYRFESEFARRLIRSSGSPVHFAPTASIRHLQYPTGGTRAAHNHLTSMSPAHSSGDYYFALLEGHGLDRWRYIGARFCGCVTARFYLKKPWFIVSRLVAEVRGLMLAISCYRNGPSLLDASRDYALDGQEGRS